MFPNLFALGLLSRNAYFLLVNANLPPSLINTQSLVSDSAIGLHVLQNPACAQHYDDSKFSILAQGRCLFHRSALYGHSHFHLSAPEVTFIKTFNPALCQQKNLCTA